MQFVTKYELTNHLDNVLAVVSDRKIAVEDGSTGTVEYYEADLVSAQDYYPFGMIMPGRSVSAGEYRYGFNSMEQDDEWSVTGGHLDFGARIYDSRLGRWLALDPKASKYPSLSPYNFVGNMPIVAIDPDGKEIKIVEEDENFRGEAFDALQSLTNDDLVLLENDLVMTEGAYQAGLNDPEIAAGMAPLEMAGEAPEDAELDFGTELVQDLLVNENTIEITESEGGNSITFFPTNADILTDGSPNTGEDATVNWNPERETGGLNVEGDYERPTFIGLGHELIHGRHITEGRRDPDPSGREDPESDEILSNEELNTRQQENRLREEHDEPLRVMPNEN